MRGVILSGISVKKVTRALASKVSFWPKRKLASIEKESMLFRNLYHIISYYLRLVTYEMIVESSA